MKKSYKVVLLGLLLLGFIYIVSFISAPPRFFSINDRPRWQIQPWNGTDTTRNLDQHELQPPSHQWSRPIPVHNRTPTSMQAVLNALIHGYPTPTDAHSAGNDAVDSRKSSVSTDINVDVNVSDDFGPPSDNQMHELQPPSHQWSRPIPVHNRTPTSMQAVLNALIHGYPTPTDAHSAGNDAVDSRKSSVSTDINVDVNVSDDFGPPSDNQTFKSVSTQKEAGGKRSCSEIHEYPLPRVYRDIHQNQLIDYFRGFGMHVTRGLGVRHTTRVTEIERRYLATPQITDMDSYPDRTKSKVYLLSKNKTYRPGERVLIRVDLYDLRGRIRTLGGDDIRVMLKTSMGFSAPATVTDLGNGSYVGEAVLHWSGYAIVSVSLTYPREFLRLAVELRHSLLSTQYLTAKYKNSIGTVIETTPCLPFSPIPGYASTCNMTEENGHAPFFCGKPTHANLSCSHPYWPGVLGFFRPLVLLGLSKKLSSLMSTTDNLRLIQNKVLIRIEKGGTEPHLPPCWSIPRRKTWQTDWHQGWLEKQRWHPESCSLPPAFGRDLLVRCLTNVTLVLLGDSNARLMYGAVTTSLGFEMQASGWHKPRVQKIVRINSTIVMVPHARPFSPGTRPDLETLSTERLFPMLPPDRSYVIVLHYWVHLNYYPLSAIRDRFRQAKRSVEKLLHQHPTAKVFLRGPHVFYNNYGHREQMGDYVGPWVKEIAREEFRELHDKVWFLDFWPITTASVNMHFHPPQYIVEEKLRVLFGYACQAQ